MVRLRLRRVGRKKQPSYRLVAAEKEAPRDGRFLEVVGFYNPRTEPSTINLKEDRIFHWLSNGAQPSDSVESLFRQMGTRDRYDRFRAGEDVEKLLEEYQAKEDSRNVTGKTRVDEAKKKPAKAEKPAVEEKAVVEPAAAEKPAAQEPAAEVEAAAEEPAAQEPAAEAEAAAEEPAAQEPAAEAEAPAEDTEEEAK